MDSDWIWRRLSFQESWRLSTVDSDAQLCRHKLEGDGHISWKRVFRDRYKLRKSWLAGKFLRGHSLMLQYRKYLFNRPQHYLIGPNVNQANLAQIVGTRLHGLPIPLTKIKESQKNQGIVNYKLSTKVFISLTLKVTSRKKLST